MKTTKHLCSKDVREEILKIPVNQRIIMLTTQSIPTRIDCLELFNKVIAVAHSASIKRHVSKENTEENKCLI